MLERARILCLQKSIDKVDFCHRLCGGVEWSGLNPQIGNSTTEPQNSEICRPLKVWSPPESHEKPHHDVLALFVKHTVFSLCEQKKRLDVGRINLLHPSQTHAHKSCRVVIVTEGDANAEDNITRNHTENLLPPGQPELPSFPWQQQCLLSNARAITIDNIGDSGSSFKDDRTIAPSWRTKVDEFQL